MSKEKFKSKEFSEDMNLKELGSLLKRLRNVKF